MELETLAQPPWVLCQQLVLGKGASLAELIPPPRLLIYTHTHTHTHTHTLTHPETSSREAVQLPFGKSRQQGTRRACNLVITAFKPQKSRIHPPLTRPAPPPGFTPAQSSAFISNSHAPPFACSPEVAFQKKQSFKHTHTQDLTTVSQT